MRSICKFAYAGVLALSFFTIQPSLAAAEDVHGVFTLTHEVYWQNQVIRPGEYAFSVKNNGMPTLLTLRGLGGSSTNAMFLVSDIDSSVDQESHLILVSRRGKSFVSSMDLPQYDMKLSFTVPSK
jgi:hypothetical protein